jgi:glyoxylase-like metal-dependent hydrolase (beta-lactamase superfamily II)
MSAIDIPTSPRQPGSGIRLFGFTIGHVHMPLSFFIDGEEGQIKAPVTAFLIDHPSKGLALFDTGLGGRFVRPRGAALESFIDIEEGDTMASRLAAIGVDAADISWIIASHLHADHAGGNADFPNATIVVHATEPLHGWSIISDQMARLPMRERARAGAAWAGALPWQASKAQQARSLTGPCGIG